MHPEKSFIEGAWMTKHNNKYYLQYSAPGTEFKCYGLGCYISDTPVGPWAYQKRNPILMHRGGLVNGCAHGCIVEGPNDSLWCFYTTLVRIEHVFERRIGMDPVGFDEHGEIYVAGPTETPQFAPGMSQHPARANDVGWKCLSSNALARASSQMPGHEPQYAVDDEIRTWWEAADAAPQWLMVDLGYAYTLYAFRTMFGDRGLDYDNGIVPGPYRYCIEGSLDRQTWSTLVDQSANTEDRHIAYDLCTRPQTARYVRLGVLEAPQRMSISVWEFSVFGTDGLQDTKPPRVL